MRNKSTTVVNKNKHLTTSIKKARRKWLVNFPRKNDINAQPWFNIRNIENALVMGKV